MITNLKKEKGFTLIELLIVVAIIAILAAIAIPQFAAYKKRGYVATMNSDAKNAYTAFMAYEVDNPTADAPTVAQLQTAGYTPSDIASPAVSGSVAANSYTIVIGPAGVASGQVSSASINQNGDLTASTAL